MGWGSALQGNGIINACIISWVIAQFIKSLYDYFTQKRIDIKRFIFGAGGMPSSHSSSVVTLAIMVMRMCGAESVEFAISVIFAAVVMYDASGVRRAAGEHARIINVLIEKWENPEIRDANLKELLGHTPFQVIAGAFIGCVVGFLY